MAQLLLLGLAFGALSPRSLRQVIELALIALVVSQLGFRIRRREAAALGLLLAVMAWWTAELVNANVPGMAVGLLGWRKSMTVFVGLALGVTVFRGVARRTEHFVVGLLVAGVATSIFVHLFAPGFEQHISRAAAESTGEFGGRSRLQGIYAGPFHVALASTYILVWALIRRRRVRAFGIVAIAVGSAGILLAEVRTSFVALVAMAGVYIWKRQGAAARARTLAVLVGAVGVLLVLIGPEGRVVESEDGALASLGQVQTDERFLYRFDTWSDATALIISRPVFGSGAGSAGDTMGSLFLAPRKHVTPHSIFLKWAVEGGLVGLSLVLLAAGYVIRPILRSWDEQDLGALAAVVMIAVFGLTGNVVEANPVCFYLAVLIGARYSEVRDPIVQADCASP